MQDLKNEYDTKKRQYDALKAGLDSGRSTLESVCFLDEYLAICLSIIAISTGSSWFLRGAIRAGVTISHTQSAHVNQCCTIETSQWWNYGVHGQGQGNQIVTVGLRILMNVNHLWRQFLLLVCFFSASNSIGRSVTPKSVSSPIEKGKRQPKMFTSMGPSSWNTGETFYGSWKWNERWPKYERLSGRRASSNDLVVVHRSRVNRNGMKLGTRAAAAAAWTSSLCCRASNV